MKRKLLKSWLILSPLSVQHHNDSAQHFQEIRSLAHQHKIVGLIDNGGKHCPQTFEEFYLYFYLITKPTIALEPIADSNTVSA